MSPAIASIAKKLELPIALYRIEGDYGAEPRWSDVVRKGKMRAYVSRVIEPEEYKNLTKEEVFALIKDGLSVDYRFLKVITNILNVKAAIKRLNICPVKNFQALVLSFLFVL